MYDGRSTTVTGAIYNYNGTEILASYNDNDIFLFNTDDTSRYVFRYDGHRNFATSNTEKWLRVNILTTNEVENYRFFNQLKE